jgi:hypothetical protein
MFERKDKSRSLDNGSVVDRRAMLQKSLLGGVALAGGAVAGFPGEALAADSSADVPSATVRRVITGNNAQGKSTVIKDETVKRGAEMWHTDSKEPLGNGLPEDTHTMLPTIGPQPDQPAGATRGYFFTIQPAKGPFDRATIKGWERGASIVYIMFLNGEITYVLDDGEVKLRAGDVLVQRNALHTWHNHTDTPVTAFAVKISL